MTILKSKLVDKRTIIATHVSHYSTTSPASAQALLEYLTEQKKAGEVLFIAHPLHYRPQWARGSFFVLYKDGKIVKEGSVPNFKFPSALTYVKDVLLSVYWSLKIGGRWNLYFGGNNLSAMAGLVLRCLGRVKKVVFCTIDYVPQRFENKILNEAYHLVDKVCVKYSDQTWNLSPRMAEGREKLRGMKRSLYNRQKVVPIGVWFKRIKRVPFVQVRKNTVVFVGHLVEKQGVQLLIRAIPKIIKEIPDFEFLIIGKGSYAENLKKLVKNLRVGKYVKFTGYIESQQEVENLIAECACGIALYDKSKDKYTYYADPMKLKDYLSAGLPVILTDVPYNAREIERKGCGLVVAYRKDNVSAAVIELLRNKSKLQTYRKNAVKYAKQFDWNGIFDKNLGEIL